MKITQTQFMSGRAETFELIGNTAKTTKENALLGLRDGVFMLHVVDATTMVVARHTRGIIDMFWEISD